MEKNKNSSERRAYPRRTAYYVFILWGDHFDEEIATIFTTELRRTGVGVKLVGLTGLQAAGLHGLVIAADFTLSQALAMADQAICVIAPCSATTLQRSEDDPRLIQFLQQALANHARLIISHASVIEQTSLHRLTTPQTPLTIYTESNNWIDLAQRTARSLAAQIESLPRR
ncbi:MAG: hypothetical protein KF832_12990 [Caldilineaceae bacterium]|nr:hypothetical protein [Caldilineaceae bacterium]